MILIYALWVCSHSPIELYFVCLSVCCFTSCPDVSLIWRRHNSWWRLQNIELILWIGRDLYRATHDGASCCGLVHKPYKLDSIVTSFETKEITCLRTYVDLLCRRTPKKVGVYNDIQWLTFKNLVEFLTDLYVYPSVLRLWFYMHLVSF